MVIRIDVKVIDGIHIQWYLNNKIQFVVVH